MTQFAQSPDRRLSATNAFLLPEMKPEGTQGRILQAALRLFAETGYSGASMRDIAGACEIRAATVYSHFPSKGQLLADLCQLGHREHVQALMTALVDGGGTPRRQIAALVRAHVGFHTRFPMLAVVANAELHHLPAALSPPIFQQRNQSIELFSEVVRRGIERGEFDVDDAWLATAAIGGMGLRVAYWFDPDGDIPANTVADTYVQFALRLLGCAADGKE